MVQVFTDAIAGMSTELTALAAVVVAGGIGVFVVKWVPKQGMKLLKSLTN